VYSEEHAIGVKRSKKPQTLVEEMVWARCWCAKKRMFCPLAGENLLDTYSRLCLQEGT